MYLVIGIESVNRTWYLGAHVPEEHGGAPVDDNQGIESSTKWGSVRIVCKDGEVKVGVIIGTVIMEYGPYLGSTILSFGTLSDTISCSVICQSGRLTQ